MLCLYIICPGSSSRRQYQRRRCVKVWRGKNLWISLTVRDWRHDGALWRPNAQLLSAKTQHRSGPTASRSIYQRPKRGSESHREHLYHTITIITLSDRASSKYIHQKQEFHFCQKAFVPFRTACNIHVKFPCLGRYTSQNCTTYRNCRPTWQWRCLTKQNFTYKL